MLHLHTNCCYAALTSFRISQLTIVIFTRLSSSAISGLKTPLGASDYQCPGTHKSANESFVCLLQTQLKFFRETAGKCRSQIWNGMHSISLWWSARFLPPQIFFHRLLFKYRALISNCNHVTSLLPMMKTMSKKIDASTALSLAAWQPVPQHSRVSLTQPCMLRGQPPCTI